MEGYKRCVPEADLFPRTGLNQCIEMCKARPHCVRWFYTHWFNACSLIYTTDASKFYIAQKHWCCVTGTKSSINCDNLPTDRIRSCIPAHGDY